MLNSLKNLWFGSSFSVKAVIIFCVLAGVDMLGFPKAALTIFWALCALGFVMILMNDDVELSDDEDGWKRGAKLVSDVQLKKLILKSKFETHASVGGVPIPIKIEPQHFLSEGVTGTGKSLFFDRLYQSARARKHKAIVVDLNGVALSKYYKTGDLILNPFDLRSQNWSIFSEIEGAWQIDSITKSLIPDSGVGEQEWNAYAQSVVAAVIESLMEEGRTTNKNLYDSLILADTKKLKEMVAGKPASRLFEEGAERMLQSVLSIVGSKVQPLRFLSKDAGKDDFSIRKWMREDDDSWLFINVKDDQLDSLKSQIGAWLDIGISALLSGQPQAHDSQKRTWFFMDELDSFGRVQSLIPLLTKARKFGGVGVGGIQVLSQLKSRYGEHDANTILSNFSSKIIFRAGDAQTAEYFSNLLGQQEIEKVTQTQSENHGERTSTTKGVSRQDMEKKIVLASEITNLPDRVGFLKLAGGLPAAKVGLGIPPKFEKVAEEFLAKQ